MTNSTNNCISPVCDRPVHAKDMCSAHYSNHRAYGDSALAKPIKTYKRVAVPAVTPPAKVEGSKLLNVATSAYAPLDLSHSMYLMQHGARMPSLDEQFMLALVNEHDKEHMRFGKVCKRTWNMTRGPLFDDFQVDYVVAMASYASMYKELGWVDTTGSLTRESLEAYAASVESVNMRLASTEVVLSMRSRLVKVADRLGLKLTAEGEQYANEVLLPVDALVAKVKADAEAHAVIDAKRLRAWGIMQPELRNPSTGVHKVG